MSAFEFVFALYSLILGLSLVELLTGLGRTLEFKLARDAEQRDFRIGWLTPLLAVFVILDLLSFWMFAWLVREEVAADRFTILGVVVFVSAYFLASRLVFPSEPEHFTDLDTHYLRVRRVVFAMLIVMVVVQWLFVATVPALPRGQPRGERSGHDPEASDRRAAASPSPPPRTAGASRRVPRACAARRRCRRAPAAPRRC